MNNVPEWYARKLQNEQPGDHLNQRPTRQYMAKVVDMGTAVPSHPRRQLFLYAILPVLMVMGLLLGLLASGVTN